MLRLAFLREFWIAARLSSPWVAEVIDTPLDSRSCLYTLMPFYDGETLEQRLRRGPPVSRAEGLDIAIKLAKGVAALHRAGVVHRDIKPDNVVPRSDGGLKLIDLGVARLPNIEDFPASAVPGTPSYMAPERHAGASGDVQSDLFALGVTIFRMFTRAYPYGEIEPFSRPRFARPPLSVTQIRPDLPSWLDQVMLRMVAARPAERFEDAFEFIFALEHATLHASPGSLPKLSLMERDPVRSWQIIAAVGDTIEVMAELHSLWSTTAAIRICRALEDYNILCAEDPILNMDDVQALADPRRQTRTPIRGSETLAGTVPFRDLLAADAIDFVMLDLASCSGLTEGRKIAALAEAYAKPLAPHDCTGPVTRWAGSQLGIHTPAAIFQEVVRATFATWYRDLVTDPPVIRDGMVQAPEAAGIGTSLRPEVRLRDDATIRVSGTPIRHAIP